MVDTIVLRIHNLEKYKGIYEQFYVTNKKKNTIVEGYNVCDVDGLVQEKERSYDRTRFYSDSGKFLPSVISFSINAPSYHYTVRCRIVHKTIDAISLEIEFSIPKYFYGTNVFQFVACPEYSSESNYYKLINGVRRFMSNHFFQVPSDKDIQIFRIDLCYNQFFLNKTEALAYQAAQREHAEKYCLAKNMRFVPHPECKNWAILTQRYSLKCYHKGTEFEDHDYKMIVKGFTSGVTKNGFGGSAKIRGMPPYDLKYLQEQADRILRYEITFRNTMIHYVTMYNFFESPVADRPAFICNDNLYKYIRRASKMGTFNKVCQSFDIQAMSGTEYFCSKVKDFMLKTEFDNSYGSAVVLSSAVTFNYPVYRLLFDFFWTKVKDMQIDTRSNVPELVKKIDDYNNRCIERKKARMTKKGDMKKVGSIGAVCWFRRCCLSILI